MSERASKRIRSQIQDHRDWLQRWAETIRSQEMDYFEKALGDDTLISLKLLSSSTETIGHYFGTRGIVRICDGDQGGWSDAAAAVECYVWSGRLNIHSYYSWILAERHHHRLAMLGVTRLAVVLLAHFVSVNDEAKENDVWSLLNMPLADGNPHVRDEWYERHFEPFFVSLYTTVRNLPFVLDPARCRYDVYAPILDKWDDSRQLKPALSTICDYHLRRMQNTRSWDAEFNCPPFDLIPVEVFAINALRLGAGLQIVDVEHPLLNAIGPFVEAPVSAEAIALFSRLQSKYDEFYSDTT